ncbi:MAG: tyrosine-type recombinase/integrase [Phycisphaerales bacterium]|nr:tyrosine-type recombinase/integrase [Phycisphaerales bacterium]
MRWLDGIDNALYSRVAALGLCQPRAGAAVVTLANLLDRFDATIAVKPSTHYKYRQVAESLRAFSGADTPLASITPAHADDWRKTLADSGLARATVAKRVVIAKGVFRKAIRWGLISTSPFAELRAGSQSNPDRSFYVSPESIRPILAACPDAQWRAVVALSRFAGLRCPSEIALLRWGDVNWERGRLTVRSPKTASHEGHAVRTVPIAPELRPILQDLFDGADEGVEAVVPRLRDPAMNLRTTFQRIIERAGETPWPRLFQNMRASCETDWVERFPAHTAAKWLGHSPLIAAQHYLHTRDTHFDLAAGIGEAAANPATHPRPSDRTDEQRSAANPGNLAVLVGCGIGCDPVVSEKVPPEGLEPSTR